MTHACYLLRSLNPRFKKSFYIGCTTDPQRRLRQHNGERGQGAHFTKTKRPWEMVLCVYGFSSHVHALQFEWAWQHPFLSLAVREAAAKLPSLKGVPGMITLVCTMVTLPKWNSLNLTLQFMLSSLLQHRQGSPPLPPQMRLIVAPIDSLPGKDSEDDNGDNEDLSTCRDALSQSVELDEDSYLNASSFAVDVQAGAIKVGLTAEFHTSHDITSSPCPPTKGKKSRKGKTPQGRKGKRGGTHKPSEDLILVDLRLSGSGSRTLFVEKEISSAERSELNDSSVVDDSRTTLTIMETMCTSSGSQRGRIDDYWYSADLSNSSPEERIPSKFDSTDDSRGSAEIGLTVCGTSAHSGSQEERAASDTLTFDSTDDSHGSVEIDLTIFGTSAHSGSQEGRAASDTFSEQDLSCAFIGERFSFQGTSKVQSSSVENRASAMALKTGETAPASHVSQGQRMDIYSVSEDLPSRSMEENVLSKVLFKDHHSNGPIANDRDSVCASRITGAASQAERVGYGQREKIGSHAVSCKHSVAKSPADRGGSNYDYGIADELSSKCFRERGPSDGISGDQSQKNFMWSSFLEGVSVAIGANHESDSDIEEINVEEFRTGEGRRKGFSVDPTCSKGGDACSVPPPASENDIVQMSVREKNVLEEKSVKGVDLQQKSLKSFFPTRKQGTVPTSIYRKARNGEICKVLEEHSSTRNAPIEIGSKGKSSGIQQALKSSSRERVQDATLLIDSDDDDEIQEISVSEFKQSSLTGKQGVTGRHEKVCSLRNFR